MKKMSPQLRTVVSISVLLAACSSATTTVGDPFPSEPLRDTTEESSPAESALPAVFDSGLTPSGPVDFDAPEDAEWFITGPLAFPLEWVEDDSLDAGFSMHVAVWPWQEVHAGPRFAGGLPGTWMAAKDGEHGFYSTIEGGTGTGAGNRFPSQGTKFTMGGVSSEFTHWANGPGAGGGLEGDVHWEDWSWDVPQGKYGVAQLSPYVLFPPDGLNMAADSSGGLLGYGYHPLPIIDARETSGPLGTVETGNQSWTLFMSTENFQGPVAFFLPDFYSYPLTHVPEVADVLDESLFLDSVGSDQNQQFEVELWEIPAAQAVDANGTPYVKTTRTQFPANGGDENSSIILNNITAYGRDALWDSTEAWFAGGDAPTGELAADGTFVKRFEDRDHVNEHLGWIIIPEGVEDGDPEYSIDWSSLVEVDLADRETFRYRWNLDRVERTDNFFVLPEYFRLDDDPSANFGKVWTPILESELPPETGLADHVFTTLDEPQNNTSPFETPTDPDSPWQSPGPASESFEVELGDGSVVTYAWYRFVDQPAMRHHDFTDAEREVIQERVEMIHRKWVPGRPYLAPPSVGELVSLDNGVLVTPPEGMEVGYVPIVTRQALVGE